MVFFFKPHHSICLRSILIALFSFNQLIVCEHLWCVSRVLNIIRVNIQPQNTHYAAQMTLLLGDVKVYADACVCRLSWRVQRQQQTLQSSLHTIFGVFFHFFFISFRFSFVIYETKWYEYGDQVNLNSWQVTHSILLALIVNLALYCIYVCDFLVFCSRPCLSNVYFSLVFISFFFSFSRFYVVRGEEGKKQFFLIFYS